MIEVGKESEHDFHGEHRIEHRQPFERTGPQTWNQTVVPVGKGPEGFDISPDGKELWMAHSRDGGVSVINIFDKRVIHTFGVQTKRSNRLKFTPDGRLVLITDLDAGHAPRSPARHFQGAETDPSRTPTRGNPDRARQLARLRSGHGRQQCRGDRSADV